MIDNEGAALEWLRSLPQATPEAMARLEQLVAMLQVENTRQNLVSAGSLGAVWQRHIVDSAQLVPHVSRETGQDAPAQAWLDLGTGAGFPGLVVAALLPQCEVVMVEARKRRVEWLQSVIDALGLARARVIGERLEQVAPRPFGVISARAFAPLDKLLKLSAAFSTRDTLFLLPKGRSAGDELAGLKRSVREGFHVEQSLTDPQAGVIVGHLNPKGLKL